VATVSVLSLIRLPSYILLRLAGHFVSQASDSSGRLVTVRRAGWTKLGRRSGHFQRDTGTSACSASKATGKSACITSFALDCCGRPPFSRPSRSASNTGCAAFWSAERSSAFVGAGRPAKDRRRPHLQRFGESGATHTQSKTLRVRGDAQVPERPGTPAYLPTAPLPTLELPEKVAPSSTARVPAVMSPITVAVAFKSQRS